MSVIVSLIHEGLVYFGADSLASGDDDAEIRRDAKIYTRGPYLIGGAGSPRANQIVRCEMALPINKPSLDAFEFMVAHFVKNLRRACVSGGHPLTDGDEFLVAYKGRVFHIDGDYAVAEVRVPYNAIGGGGVAARVAFLQQELLMLRGLKIAGKQRVLDALHAAETMVTTVRRPFVILTQKL